MHSVMLQDVLPKTHAMTRPVNTPEEITKIYDFVAYPKAASVIRMIEHIMTPDIFRKALTEYIEERYWKNSWLRFLRWKLFCLLFYCRSYKTATDEQLYEVLERVRRENSDASYPEIPAIFRSWANNPGFPILNVNFFSENKTAKVRQELFVPFINRTDISEFHVLFNYALSSSNASGFVETFPSKWIQGAEVEMTLDGLTDDERWVIFNIQQTGEMN